MAYLIVYTVFSVLFNIGVTLGEILNDVKPNWWQLVAILLAPITLPVILGMYFVSYINR